jgi:H+/Cl- antiporter ClcA
MLAFFIIPFAVFKLWAWFWFFICVGILLGCFELKFKTLTDMFRRFKDKNKKQAWLIAGSLACGWTVLLIHLMR